MRKIENKIRDDAKRHNNKAKEEKPTSRPGIQDSITADINPDLDFKGKLLVSKANGKVIASINRQQEKRPFFTTPSFYMWI